MVPKRPVPAGSPADTATVKAEKPGAVVWACCIWDLYRSSLHLDTQPSYRQPNMTSAGWLCSCFSPLSSSMPDLSARRPDNEMPYAGSWVGSCTPSFRGQKAPFGDVTRLPEQRRASPSPAPRQINTACRNSFTVMFTSLIMTQRRGEVLCKAASAWAS